MVKMKNKSAQIIPEFIIVTAAVLGLMLFIFVIAAQKGQDSMNSQRFLETKSIADSFSLAINQVHLGGPETRRIVWIPKNLPEGTSYSLYVIPSARIVRIEWNSTVSLQFYDSQILTSNVDTSRLNNTGKFPRIRAGQIKVYNSGGGVILEPV